jgi:hypothetical protein
MKTSLVLILPEEGFSKKMLANAPQFSAFSRKLSTPECSFYDPILTKIHEDKSILGHALKNAHLAFAFGMRTPPFPKRKRTASRGIFSQNQAVSREIFTTQLPL